MISLNAPSLSKTAKRLFEPTYSNYYPYSMTPLSATDRYWGRVLVATMLAEMVKRARTEIRLKRLVKLTKYFLPNYGLCYKGHRIGINDHPRRDCPKCK